MQLKQFLIASAAIGASAMPTQPVARNGNYTLSSGLPFTLMALRSASPIHFASLNAAKSSIFLQLPSPNATCDSTSDGRATFILKDGVLSLYSTTTLQELYVDRSGMGQGKLGYTTGDQGAPRNAERSGWILDDVNDLTFNNASLLACPNSIDGAYSIWVSTGTSTPGGNTDCLGFSARAVEATTPNSCVYTQ